MMFYVEIAYFQNEGKVFGFMSSERKVSDICKEMGIDTGNMVIGVDGEEVPSDHVIKSSCRIELYPPLQIDPKERRERIVETKRKRGG